MAELLSPLEFAVASAGLKCDEGVLNTVRRVLVDGEERAAVAREIGKNKQWMGYWARQVTEAWEKQSKAMAAVAPDGWEVRIVAAPADQMAKIMAITEIEHQKLIAEGA